MFAKVITKILHKFFVKITVLA